LLENYWDEFFAEFYPMARRSAEAYIDRQGECELDVIRFMERETGCSLDDDMRIVGYPTYFAKPFAWGLKVDGTKIVIFDSSSTEHALVFASFHELLHDIMDGLHRLPEVRRLEEVLQEDEGLRKAYNELTQGQYWIEENLVMAAESYLRVRSGLQSAEEAEDRLYTDLQRFVFKALLDEFDVNEMDMDVFLVQALEAYAQERGTAGGR